MEQLIEQINELKNNSIGKLVRQRMQELEQNFEDNKKTFSELCFCITTANSSADMGIKVQKALHGKIHKLDRKQISKELRKLGYRFYNKRAHYIHSAKKWIKIKKIISGFENGQEAREWLVKNILGFGYKEASHFLRNIGFKEVAILDRHVIRTMYENNMIKDLPKTLTRKKYLEYEKKLEKLCKATKLKQGELDFYLWYIRTGKILK
ncbi:N-glycosylase/DNA lyase [Candidatus Micrarchaeota archaeon]|nr:N-glycosylase/DNA lyase [Candidatus Micrarchaeota archaeon]